MNFGPPELLVMVLVVLVLFGGSRLPKLARSLGEARRELDTTMSAPAPASTPAAAEDA